VDLHELGERRSIALHDAIAQRLDAAMVQRALARVETWQSRGLLHPRLAGEWRTLLALPLDALARQLGAADERMARLRSVSPFAGELSPRERWTVWRHAREAVST
jgi:hypothetical protein